MKKLILVAMMSFLFIGCATDGIYGVGKAVVKANEDKVKPKTLDKLKRYDRTRTSVRTFTDQKKDVN
jgi:hypothetical protein